MRFPRIILRTSWSDVMKDNLFNKQVRGIFFYIRNIDSLNAKRYLIFLERLGLIPCKKYLPDCCQPSAKGKIIRYVKIYFETFYNY